jgi:hypothetical protein
MNKKHDSTISRAELRYVMDKGVIDKIDMQARDRKFIDAQTFATLIREQKSPSEFLEQYYGNNNIKEKMRKVAGIDG